MYICYEKFGDKIIKYIPDDCPWTIKYISTDENGYGVGEIWLEAGDEKLKIIDCDYWMNGTPKLPFGSVDDYFQVVLDKIAEILAKEDVRLLDLSKIMDEVMLPIWPEWKKAGYVDYDYVK